VPSGWKVYRGGAQLPMVIAYPPDWTVDESKLSNNIVVFNAPDQLTEVQIDAEKVSAGANIDVLRDQFFKGVSGVCDKAGVEATDYGNSSGIRFAELAATCDVKGTLLLFYVGSGLSGSVEWDFLLVSLYKDFNKNTCKCAQGNYEKYFAPMLATLNIYGNP
jgi:hypothetical protein